MRDIKLISIEGKNTRDIRLVWEYLEILWEENSEDLRFILD